MSAVTLAVILIKHLWDLDRDDEIVWLDVVGWLLHHFTACWMRVLKEVALLRSL